MLNERHKNPVKCEKNAALGDKFKNYRKYEIIYFNDRSGNSKNIINDLQLATFNKKKRAK